jgi:hypothetical protein
VSSGSSVRLWRVCKEAGRPWPTVSDDPVLDYMVMEAVYLKVRKEDEKAAKAAEREEWKKRRKEELKETTRGQTKR